MKDEAYGNGDTGSGTTPEGEGEDGGELDIDRTSSPFSSLIGFRCKSADDPLFPRPKKVSIPAISYLLLRHIQSLILPDSTKCEPSTSDSSMTTTHTFTMQAKLG